MPPSYRRRNIIEWSHIKESGRLAIPADRLAHQLPELGLAGGQPFDAPAGDLRHGLAVFNTL
jgi:hypothetical protein